MGASRWFDERRADAVSHGVPGRLVYTILFVAVLFVLLSLGAVGFVVALFVLVFGGIPFLWQVWKPSASTLKRQVHERERIDPEPGPREMKAPKRW